MTLTATLKTVGVGLLGTLNRSFVKMAEARPPPPAIEPWRLRSPEQG
jgi:hypothetical protein